MDVAGKEDHGRGRRATLPIGHVDHGAGDPLERVLEGRPVLEIESLPDPLTHPSGAATPGTGGDRLVPRLQMMQADRKQERQGCPEQQVVDVAGQDVVEPVGLGRVQHLPRLVVELASGSAVDHEQPGPAQVAVVAPAI